MKTFKDFLIWYNNKDVNGFVEAVEKIQSFYRDLRVDMFKDAISILGIARKLLFKMGMQNGASFALFDEKNQDIYKTIKTNLFGGPSIVMTRHAEVDKTFIRTNSAKPCKKILDGMQMPYIFTQFNKKCLLVYIMFEKRKIIFDRIYLMLTQKNVTG